MHIAGHYAIGMTKVICNIVTLLAVAILLALPCSAQSAAPYQYFRVGNAADVQVHPRAGFALMGGGEDLDEAFRWLCDRANGGDLLVIRATGTDAYNPYIQGLCKLNSVATLVIPDGKAAHDPFVAAAIAKASAVFISGGDQSNYINYWMGSPVQAELNDAIARGVPVGGTSAGLAVLGEFVYSAQGDKPKDPNLDAKTALADPYSSRITLVSGFLKIAPLAAVITDSHFVKRDRMGRLLVFLAKLNYPAAAAEPRVRGIGVDERSSLLLEPDGRGTVVGHGAVYLIDTHEVKGKIAAGKPVEAFGSFGVQKAVPGKACDLKAWMCDGPHYSLRIEAGVVRSTQEDETIY